MAILKGIEVKILVNGVALPEFNNDDDEKIINGVTKYITAVTGAAFQIQVVFKCKIATACEGFVATSMLTDPASEAKCIRTRQLIFSEDSRPL